MLLSCNVPGNFEVINFTARSGLDYGQPVKYGIKNLKRTGKISFSEIRLHKPSDQFPNTI